MPSRSTAPRLLVVSIVLTLASTACGGATASSAPSPSAAASASRSDAPSEAPSDPPETDPPRASLDPSMSAAELFADESPIADLGVAERSREARDGAVIRDIRYAGADGREVAAYVVTPETGTPRGGVLFLHWQGEDTSSREQYLPEAVRVAASGLASVLITQRFPWAERPSGVEHDRVAVGFQVRTIRRAVTILAGAAGAVPLAVVGHDFGAMYATLLRGVDERPTAYVLLAPTATWADWFVTYFHVVGAGEAPAYETGMADVDPVTWLPEASAPILLQLAAGDQYVLPEAVSALEAAAGEAAETRTYEATHRLNDQARDERVAWLLEALGLT